MGRLLSCGYDISLECLVRFRPPEDMVAAQKLADTLEPRMEELQLTLDRSKSGRYEGQVPPKWVESATQVLGEAGEVLLGLQKIVAGEAPFAAETKTAAQEAQKGILLQAIRLRNLLAEASLRP